MSSCKWYTEDYGFWRRGTNLKRIRASTNFHNSHWWDGTLCIVPTICNPICSQTIEAAVKKYPHLQAFSMTEKSYSFNEIEVDVLLGADYYWNFVTNIRRRGDSPGPVAIWTKLGWVLSGPVITSNSNYPDHTTVNLSSTHVYVPKLNDELAKFWDL